jgi:hypothetical protein
MEEAHKGKKFREVKDPNNSRKLSWILGICLVVALLFIGYLLFNQYHEARRNFDRAFEDGSQREPYGSGPSFSDMTESCIDKSDGEACQVSVGNETSFGNCTIGRNQNLICIVPIN